MPLTLTGAGGNSGAFNPGNIPNLKIWLRLLPGNSFLSGPPAGTPAAVGAIVVYTKPQSPTTVYGKQASAGPVQNANGLNGFNESPTRYPLIDSVPFTEAITTYAIGTLDPAQVPNSGLVASSISGTTEIDIASDYLNVSDESAGGSVYLDIPGILSNQVITFSRSSLLNNGIAQCTGSVAQPNPTLDCSTQVGSFNISSLLNATTGKDFSVLNGFASFMAIERAIANYSTEDQNIQNWLCANNLAATPASSSSVIVDHWVPSYTGGVVCANVDGRYRIGSGAWTTVTNIGFGTRWTVTGLTANTSYRFQCKYTMSDGYVSPWSVSATATTNGAGLESAIWEYPSRTLVTGTPDTPATRAEQIAQTIWEYGTRTLT